MEHRLPTKKEWAAFSSVLADFPDWLAWRMEAWVVAMKDLQDPRILPWDVLRSEHYGS